MTARSGEPRLDMHGRAQAREGLGDGGDGRWCAVTDAGDTGGRSGRVLMIGAGDAGDGRVHGRW
ncbi:hypothetical protein CDL15_Pgr012355 [Punica granatum]|uniref:Uncharacterized protein n=1 Tax=Punica granatum TaxID=22663 RepID=A0A218X5L5_PUNGR|nr:hypothetical protein CDL15_Pgr012355 [Punica granatum]